jgi:hypothetical protein
VYWGKGAYCLGELSLMRKPNTHWLGTDIHDCESPVGLPKRSREFIVKKAGEPAVAVSAVTRGKVGAGTTVGAPVVGMKVGSGVLAIVGKLDVGALVTGAFVCPAEVGCWVTTPIVGFSVAPIAVGVYVVGCELVGLFEGKTVGITVGVAVGNEVGCQVGNWVVGDLEGPAVGTTWETSKLVERRR